MYNYSSYYALLMHAQLFPCWMHRRYVRRMAPFVVPLWSLVSGGCSLLVWLSSNTSSDAFPWTWLQVCNKLTTMKGISELLHYVDCGLKNWWLSGWTFLSLHQQKRWEWLPLLLVLILLLSSLSSNSLFGLPAIVLVTSTGHRTSLE